MICIFTPNVNKVLHTQNKIIKIIDKKVDMSMDNKRITCKTLVYVKVLNYLYMDTYSENVNE